MKTLRQRLRRPSSPSKSTVILPPNDFSKHDIIHVPRRFVSTEWGGTESVILEISRCQQRAGMHPTIFTSMALATGSHDEMNGIPVQRFLHCYPWFGLSSAEISIKPFLHSGIFNWSFSWPITGVLLKSMIACCIKNKHAPSLGCNDPSVCMERQ